ncbi:MAG: hypothetical protein HGA49_12785 [Eubacteriaceae bacterium]|nr:hypothetical protein [Eubacteriaceae bacterium]
MNQIQELRKELTDFIINRVKPIRDRLDELLNEEAKKICPFSINDIIILDNGKEGIIKEINYYSLNYDFSDNKFIDKFSNYLEVDEIEYKYAYTVDNKKFSITWNISGLRMRKDGTEGKKIFTDINPVSHIIDKHSKIVKQKDLNDYTGNTDIRFFEDLSS